jgi:hypothetical protein
MQPRVCNPYAVYSLMVAARPGVPAHSHSMLCAGTKGAPHFTEDTLQHACRHLRQMCHGQHMLDSCCNLSALDEAWGRDRDRECSRQSTAAACRPIIARDHSRTNTGTDSSLKQWIVGWARTSQPWQGLAVNRATDQVMAPGCCCWVLTPAGPYSIVHSRSCSHRCGPCQSGQTPC